MPPKPPADKVAELEAEVAAAKKAWDAIRGTPEGLALAPDGRPKQRPFRLKYERLQGELVVAHRPGCQWLRRPWCPGREDVSRTPKFASEARLNGLVPPYRAVS